MAELSSCHRNHMAHRKIPPGLLEKAFADSAVDCLILLGLSPSYLLHLLSLHIPKCQFPLQTPLPTFLFLPLFIGDLLGNSRQFHNFYNFNYYLSGDEHQIHVAVSNLCPKPQFIYIYISSILLHLTVGKSFQTPVLFFFQVSMERPIILLVTQVQSSHHLMCVPFIQPAANCYCFYPTIFLEPVPFFS